MNAPLAFGLAALIGASVTSPSLAQSIPAIANVPIPTHELNFSPPYSAMPGYTRDLTLLAPAPDRSADRVATVARLEQLRKAEDARRRELRLQAQLDELAEKVAQLTQDLEATRVRLEAVKRERALLMELVSPTEFGGKLPEFGPPKTAPAPKP